MVKKTLRKTLVRALLLAAVVALIFYFAGWAEENDAIRRLVASYNYAGIFLVALISGFNLAIPVPAAAFLPLFLEAGLRFWPTIATIAIGVTFADIIAYFIGKVGHEIISHSTEGKIFSKLEHARDRYHWAPLAILFAFASLAPLPNEIILVPTGFLGYRLFHILPVVLAGNFVFNAIYATGAVSLFEAL